MFSSTKKYMIVRLFPIDSNGGSTGFAPIHVSRKKILTKDQNFSLDNGLNFFDFVFIKGRIANTRMDARRATTPPSFEGIERRMA